MRNKLRFEVPCEIVLDTMSGEVTLLVSGEGWEKYASDGIEDLTKEELGYVKEAGLPVDGLTIGLL